MRRLHLFYKAFQNRVPKHIHSSIPPTRTYAGQPNSFTSFCSRTGYCKRKISSSATREWKKLVPIYEAVDLLNIIIPSKRKIYDIYDQASI